MKTKFKTKTKSLTRIISLLLAMILLSSLLVLPVSAATSWPSLSSTAYCEFTATKNINCWRNSACTIRGTILPDKSYNALIEKGDICRIININSSTITLEYPTSTGYRRANIRRADLIGVSTPTEKVTSQGKVTTYKNTNGTAYGNTAKGDVVYALGTSGNYTLILYSAKNARRAYKLAYVRTTDYNNVIKKPHTVENGVRYTNVTVTLDTSSLSNWMKSYLKAQDSLGGQIVSQTVHERRQMKVVQPLAGPSYNGKTPTKTTTIYAPYRVTFKVHTHERKMGYGSSWRLVGGNSITTEYACSCGYRNTILVWEIPLPDPSEYAAKEIVNTIRSQANTYYWLNNVK